MNITIDLGSTGTFTERRIDFHDLESIALAGQTLSLDFIFADGKHINASTVQHIADLVLYTSALSSGEFTGGADTDGHGTGFCLDASLSPLHAARLLGRGACFESGATEVTCGLLPLLQGWNPPVP